MTTTVPTAGLTRSLTDAERAAYQSDGAAIVRGILPIEWVETLRTAVDRLMADDEAPSVDFAAGNGPRFFTLLSASGLDPVFRAWALAGPLVELARQVMPEASSLNFYFDQIFAREPGSSKVTPFHQDAPYMSVMGPQILRLWVPLDVVNVDNGAVRYLRGSHRGPVYRARSFDESNPVAASYDAGEFEPLPDFAATYDRYDWLIGECEPTDVVLHHPGTVHGSMANIAATARRAVSSIYTGDTTRWAPHDSSASRNKALTGHIPIPDLTPGAPIDCELFPRVWTSG